METQNQLIVYTGYAGLPLQLTFLGGEWWVTTPGELLQPARKLDLDGFICLTTSSGSVDALGLAKMLGKTVENPVDELVGEMHRNMKSLHRMDCFEAWAGQTLSFEWSIEQKEKPGSGFKEEYCLTCRETYYNEEMFSIDGFADKKTATYYAEAYFDMLREEGVSVTEKKVKEVKR